MSSFKGPPFCLLQGPRGQQDAGAGQHPHAGGRGGGEAAVGSTSYIWGQARFGCRGLCRALENVEQHPWPGPSRCQ